MAGEPEPEEPSSDAEPDLSSRAVRARELESRRYLNSRKLPRTNVTSRFFDVQANEI